MVHLIALIDHDLTPVHETDQLQQCLVIERELNLSLSKFQRWSLEYLIFIPLPEGIIQLMPFGIIEGQNQAKNVATEDHPKGWRTSLETLEWPREKDPRRNNDY